MLRCVIVKRRSFVANCLDRNSLCVLFWIKLPKTCDGFLPVCDERAVLLRSLFFLSPVALHCPTTQNQAGLNSFQADLFFFGKFAGCLNLTQTNLTAINV